MMTVSLARISDTIPLYDTFHFRENSASRKKLAEHLGHQMRVLVAEHIASQVPFGRFEEVYQRAIGDAEAGQRASKVKAKLAELDPWEPDY